MAADVLRKSEVSSLTGVLGAAPHDDIRRNAKTSGSPTLLYIVRMVERVVPASFSSAWSRRV